MVTFRKKHLPQRKIPRVIEARHVFQKKSYPRAQRLENLKNPYQYVVHLTSYIDFEKDLKRVKSKHSHRKGSAEYTTRITAPKSNAREKIISRIFYARTEEEVDRYVRKGFNKFFKSKETSQTATVQFFRGKIQNHFRGYIEGEVSDGAKIDAIYNRRKDKKRRFFNALNSMFDKLDAITIHNYTQTRTEGGRKWAKVHKQTYKRKRRK